jgi:hypothetical protein
VIYPKVSIILLNWNGLEDTTECLESLKRITYPNYEVIVVDNGSRGNDAEVLQEKFGNYVHLIKNDRNYGFSGGNNIGIRYVLNNSSPDYILLLNNDTVVDTNFLTEMVKVAERDSSIGMAGAKIYCYDNAKRLHCVWHSINMRWGRLSTVGFLTIDKGQYEKITEVDCVQASCCLAKRELVERIGLLDESYFLGWEDIDYCLRATRAGYKITYVPKAKIWHKGSSASMKVSQLWGYYRGRNWFLFMKKHSTHGQYVTFLLRFFIYQLWATTTMLLFYHRSIKAASGFWKGVKDGLVLDLGTRQ